jgi:hypothetical protein
MKYFSSFLFFFFISISLLAQYEYLISVHNKLGNKIQYASISWGKTTGVSANESGIAKISSTSPIDTIYASCVGYPIQSFLLNNLPRSGDTIRIVLFEQSAVLPPITIFSKEKISEVGITENETSFISNRYRNVIAALEVRQPSEICKIKSISVFIHKKSQLNVPFRIRIFSKNSSGLPDNDLLISSIICKSYQLNKWNEISLENDNVFVSVKEFFIAIEWLSIAELKDNNDLQVGLTNKNVQIRTFFKLANKPWRKSGTIGSKVENIMLKAYLVY